MRRKRTKGKNWAKTNTYRGVQYRSLWETYVSKLLLYSGIASQYEPKRFFLSTGVSYLPDFYLPDLNIYIEVKGWLKPTDKTKITMFKTKVTSRLLYLGEAELSYIHGGKASELSKINYEAYIPTREEIRKFQELLRRVQ